MTGRLQWELNTVAAVAHTDDRELSPKIGKFALSSVLQVGETMMVRLAITLEAADLITAQVAITTVLSTMRRFDVPAELSINHRANFPTPPITLPFS